MGEEKMMVVVVIEEEKRENGRRRRGGRRKGGGRASGRVAYGRVHCVPPLGERSVPQLPFHSLTMIEEPLEKWKMYVMCVQAGKNGERRWRK